MSVEVERKFVCDANIQDKLREIGAVCVGQCQFEDKYFDTPAHHLTLRDVWLRCRQGSWELKCPTQESGNPELGLCSRYREITSLPEIIAKVEAVIKESSGDEKHDTEQAEEQKKADRHDQRAATEMKPGKKESGEGGFPSWLGKLNLLPFAVFTTNRCSFRLDGDTDLGGVRVDLDQADFGFCIGEIEVLVPDGEEMHSALEKIERTAHRLGLSGDKRVPGKMNVYLQRYCPEHFKELFNANIL
uniref:Thiamine-triphosphatase n=1 Tax=Paramormyrops kingsleyae TaxID=1676925 RepID=A0A3B3S317_9TELE|nr:thiamine-triphosphatase [Paramormyrops kingsleyae]